MALDVAILKGKPSWDINYILAFPGHQYLSLSALRDSNHVFVFIRGREEREAREDPRGKLDQKSGKCFTLILCIFCLCFHLLTPLLCFIFQGNSGNDGPPGPPGERVCCIIPVSKVRLFKRNLKISKRLMTECQLFFLSFSGFARASGTNRFSRTKRPSCKSEYL